MGSGFYFGKDCSELFDDRWCVNQIKQCCIHSNSYLSNQGLDVISACLNHLDKHDQTFQDSLLQKVILQTNIVEDVLVRILLTFKCYSHLSVLKVLTILRRALQYDSHS